LRKQKFFLCLGKANNETEFQNRAGGEPAPHGWKSGLGRIKKWRKFAEKTMGGLVGRPRKNRKNFGKFDCGITLQPSKNLFSRKFLKIFLK